MAMDGLRGYLQLASGLAEMSRARATEAASALLSLSSGLAGGRSSSAVQVQVQDLAEELLAAAAANRRSLIALVRSEVERAMARSPIPPDELDRARAAVAKLSADVEELRAQVLANPAVGEVASRLGLGGGSHTQPAESDVAPTRPPSSDDGVVVDVAFTGRLDETVDPPPRRRPPRRQISGAATRPVPGAVAEGPASASEPRTETGATRTPARSRTTKGASTASKASPASGAVTTKGSAVTKAATKKATPAQKSTARKPAATKTAATKTAATKTAATKTPTRATPAKKSTAKSTATKATATKTATRSTPANSTAKKSTAKTSTAKKSTAKKSTAKRSTAKKSTAAKSATPRAGGGS
jgi:hypothetical protein